MTSLHVEIAVLAISSAFQLVAAAVAFYLIRYSGSYRYAWICISMALLLMSERRVEPLYDAVIRGKVSATLSSTVGLAISVLMVVGVLGVKTLFVRLKRQEDELRQLASTDSLTGLANYRETMAQARHETERHLRLNHPLALLMVDVDHFKRVNDTYGHARGDEVLKMVAHTCRACLRKIDVFGRIGGEEFLAILPEAALPDARAIAERMRVAVETRPLTAGAPAVTVSVGIAMLDHAVLDPAMALESMLARVDGALYAAKAAGRNRLAVAEASPPQ